MVLVCFVLLSACKSESTQEVAETVEVEYSDDLAPLTVQSSPNKIYVPEGLSKKVDINFEGAFRVVTKGESNSNYAVGTLAYNPYNDSIFMAGHSHHNAIAEFAIPETLSFAERAKDIVAAETLQSYVKVLDKKQVGKQTTRITGMLVYQQALLINSEIWYDGGGKNKDNLQVFDNIDSLSTSSFKGMLQLEGGAKAAGYMSPIPKRWQTILGGKYLTGWASNYSITSRYSQGPSMYIFNPSDAINADINGNRQIQTKPMMVFPLEKGKELVAGGSGYIDDVSPLWGASANGRYGFILPESDYFLVVGYHSGVHSGLGYKITQNNGQKCGGGCAKDASDIYNYYWLFDVNDIFDAQAPHKVKPIAYGKWSHPYDRGGKSRVLGASYDYDNDRLFLSLSNAAQTGKYDRPPLVIVYKIIAK
jgi:hypothetical protein